MKDDFLGNKDDTTMDSKDDEFDIPTSPKKILDEGKQKVSRAGFAWTFLNQKN